MWSLMAQMPAPAPVILLPSKFLRMCAGKVCEGRESAVSERSAAREGREQAARRRSARSRRGEEEKDAQGSCKLRELAERVWNGAADLVVLQVPAKVRAEGVRRGESAVSERRA